MERCLPVHISWHSLVRATPTMSIRSPPPPPVTWSSSSLFLSTNKQSERVFPSKYLARVSHTLLNLDVGLDKKSVWRRKRNKFRNNEQRKSETSGKTD